ncbi:hypothetical protein Tco_1226315 [Tanacetum coccineum]
MANLSEDIQCAGSDTRPPMLDKTDFVSWQQRIRLYCRGKENGVNILKSIDEGPFQMGTIRDPIAEGTEGAQQLGLERARVYSDLSPEDKDRYNADIRATNILLQGLPKDIYTLINHYTEAKDIWDNVKMLLEGSELTKEDRESQLVDRIEVRGTMHEVQVQLVMGELRTELGMQIQVKQGKLSATTATENKVALDEEQLLFITGGQDNAKEKEVGGRNRVVGKKVEATGNRKREQGFFGIGLFSKGTALTTSTSEPHNSEFFKDKVVAFLLQKLRMGEE